MSQRSTAVASRRRSRTAGSMVETLENRQLLSLVIDLRLPGGGKSANVNTVGQVVNLEVWATVKGADTSGSNDGLQTVVGSLLSTNVSGGAANGTLKVTPTAPFNNFGSTKGASRDLDGDGDLDVGTNVTTDGSDYFATRSMTVTKTGGVVSGASHAFKIGTGTFTVTSLKSTTGQTNLVFRVRGGSGSSAGGLWQEDNKLPLKKDVTGGVMAAGSALVVKRGTGGSPPPPPPPPGATVFISGKVFNDTNANGSLNSGESGKGNVRVYVDKNKNNTLDSGEPTKLTDSGGNYTFTGLAALSSGSTYRVRIQTPSGFRITSPTSGFLETVGNYGGKNFGLAAATTGTTFIGGKVWNDANGNGALDSGEAGKGSVRVYVDKNKNGSLDSGEPTQLTNSTGNYTFTGLARLASGQTYRVRIQTPSGYRITNPGSGFLDTAGGWSNKNFGITTNVLLSGRVFVDSNNNFKKDSNESSLVGWKVFLDRDFDGRQDAGEVGTRTDSSGNFIFRGQPARHYHLVIVPATSGFVRLGPSSGFYDLFLSSGQTRSFLNFRFKRA